MRFSVVAALGAMALVATAGSAAQAATLTFDNPGDVAGWTVDRYAPAGFDSGVVFNGDERLRVTLSASDGATGRPGAFSSAFYNTQGKATAVAGGLSQTLGIDFYLDDAFAGANRRVGGLWGVAVDGADDISAYPIIEFASDAAGGGARFQGWDNGAWVNLTLLDPITDYDTWYRFDIALSGPNWIYSVTNRSNPGQTWSASVDNGGSVGIRNVIVQGYNTNAGVNAEIYFDNLRTGAVPEPASWALMILGFGAAGSVLRGRRGAFV